MPLVMNRFHHVGIGRIGFDQRNRKITTLEVVGQRKRDKDFSRTALAATHQIDRVCRCHARSLQTLGVRRDLGRERILN